MKAEGSISMPRGGWSVQGVPAKLPPPYTLCAPDPVRALASDGGLPPMRNPSPLTSASVVGGLPVPQGGLDTDNRQPLG